MDTNTRRIKTTYFYSMIALLGIIFLIVGVLFQNDGMIFHRMMRVGLGLLVVGIVFLLAALKVQSREKNDKNLQRLNHSILDERNQLIAGKSASITSDVMMVLGLLACGVFSFLGMNNYAYVIIGYMIINNILQLGVGIYLRTKL